MSFAIFRITILAGRFTKALAIPPAYLYNYSNYSNYSIKKLTGIA